MRRLCDDSAGPTILSKKEKIFEQKFFQNFEVEIGTKFEKDPLGRFFVMFSLWSFQKSLAAKL